MYSYLHIPFCRQKCPYCKFALTPFVQDAKIARYIAFMAKEIEHFFETKNPDTPLHSIYFGWGTPSVLSVEQIGFLLSKFPREIWASNIEITLEANPEDITEEFVRGIRELWINRLSLGIQSLQDETLTAVHRSSRATIFEALDCTLRAGFTNVNVDFILGLPHTRAGETLQAIRELHERYANIKHTSVYFLEKGDYPKDWKALAIDDQAMTDEYSDIVHYLTERGLHHYEISNFGKPGHESRHNRAYWTHQNVRGFGLSAASHWDGTRFENAASFAAYYRGEVVGQETLTEHEIALESAMFWLRTFSLPISAVADASRLKTCIDQGLLLQSGEQVRPTLPWIFVLDHIMAELL